MVSNVENRSTRLPPGAQSFTRLMASTSARLGLDAL
jgi:hypothetical protein